MNKKQQEIKDKKRAALWERSERLIEEMKRVRACIQNDISYSAKDVLYSSSKLTAFEGSVIKWNKEVVIFMNRYLGEDGV